MDAANVVENVIGLSVDDTGIQDLELGGESRGRCWQQGRD